MLYWYFVCLLYFRIILLACLCVTSMGSNITCSTLVATLAVIMVLLLFTPASNRNINRMMLSPIVDISVIDTQVSLRLFPQKNILLRRNKMLLLLQKLYRRVAKPTISDRRIFLAVNVLKKPAQYLFAVVANVLLLLAWSTIISNAAETSEAVRSVTV